MTTLRVFQHSPDKVGRDAGELFDRPITGIRASADVGVLLALDAPGPMWCARSRTGGLAAAHDTRQWERRYASGLAPFRWTV